MKRYLVMVVLASISLSSLVGAASANAAPRDRCFSETGYCVSGAILEYWERNGGLPVFGYPITPLRTEQVEGQALPVQWFQRDRLEDHGALGVMAGRLGAEILAAQGTPWETLSPAAETPAGCRYFAETRHSLCEPFLSYWNRNGGLPRFGYPLSQPQSESVGNWKGTVQYFERRRMEHHIELAGTPYEVLLGLLGRTGQDLAALQTCGVPVYEPWRAAFTRVSFSGVFVCPAAPAEEAPASAQLFERGHMIRVKLRGEFDMIFVFPLNPPGVELNAGDLLFDEFVDDWDESQPIDGGQTPPPDRYEPQRGFGKVWREHPEIRERLGWAIAQEQPGTAIYQASNLVSMLSLPYLDPPMLYAFGPYSRVEIVDPQALR
jgi:hypothetical protein